MIPDFPNFLSVSVGNFIDVRGVDDHFAPVRNYRFVLVHHFSGHPNVIIDCRCDAEHFVISMVDILDVDSLKNNLQPFPRPLPVNR